MNKIKTPADLDRLRKTILDKRDPDAQVVRVCCTTGCRAGGALKIVDGLETELAKTGLQDKVLIKKTGCRGFCENGPVVSVEPQNIFYNKVKPQDIPDVISDTLVNGRPVKRLLYKDSETRAKITNEGDIPFFGKQVRNVFANLGRIDPSQIDEYIAEGGYTALCKALTTMEPEQIIEAVEASGLRGRGGGGFPTGRKWRSCWEAPGDVRYVIANGDEGDPGAFMDRSLMEGDPHSIIEGMIIGAFAIGANQGFIYVRDEYPIAVQHFTIAIGQANSYGLLGENILGAGFDFTLEIERGAGAFVCGESTALMNSLEGRVGEPRAKYVHTAESGLWNRPSNLNNVETWANIPLIINRGAEWYAGTGTPNSKGTKIFSLVGKVQNTGLVEVPMGITLREIIYDIGGGIRKNKRFKAVQTGGPSGGCIPMSRIDMPVDFDSLKKAGAIMGSGGMIVMDEDTCMVDVARYFINFLMYESCGKCVPCREGLKQMNKILVDICEGYGQEGDIELLQELSSVMADASLCALGGTAPNPVLSTIRYFRDEYEAHIFDKECPAGVCRNPRIIRVLEFGCESPKKFYEHCMSCPQFGENCPELALSAEILQGAKKVVFSSGEPDSKDAIHVSAFGCKAPLSYFEKSRKMCGREGRCREEGLLIELLTGEKDLIYSNTQLRKL